MRLTSTRGADPPRAGLTLGGLTVAGVLALALVPAAGRCQPGPERNPKTFDELQRQSGHVWDLAIPSRVAAAKTLKNKAFQRALDDHRAGKGDLRHDLDVSWGEFLSGTGKPFLALALDRPHDADLEPGQQVTLFGEVIDAAGAVVADFETQDVVEVAAGRSVVDAALPLPAGRSRLVVGLAIRGKVRWLVERELEVRALDPATFALSRPVLSLDVHPLAAPQRPDDPFSFGGLRVTPRGDRAFRTAEEPWFFVVARVPGTTPSLAPSLKARLLIAGPEEGKTRTYPVGGLTPAPMRGFDGQWGLGIPLPVKGLPPGEYRATLEVTEKATSVIATAESSFSVVAP